MSDMLAFCTGLLHAVAEFLSSEPMIYVFALLIIIFAVKLILLLRPRI